MCLEQIPTLDLGGNPPLDCGNGYDKRGNVFTKATEQGEYVDGYDNLYRLTMVDNPTKSDEAFTNGYIQCKGMGPRGEKWTSSGK